MRRYILRSMVRAILDQPRVPKRYQSAINAEVLKRIAETTPRRKNKVKTPVERFWRRIVQQGECWLWRGRGMNISTADGVVHPRRFAIEHFAGLEIPRGKNPVPACGQPACVNPEHQTLRRKGESRLTEDQIAAIRTDTRPYPQIAKAYGICRSYVSQIRSGKRCSPYSGPIQEFKLLDRFPGQPSQ
jgi:hypothetical protein